MHLRTIALHLVSLIRARALHVAVAPVLICLASGVGEGAVVTQDSNGFVTSITGLDVSGTTYDVTFAFTSFNDVYGTGDPPSTFVPTFYNDAAGAVAAREAIQTTLNAAQITGPAQLIGAPTRNNGVPTTHYDFHYTFETTTPRVWDDSVFAFDRGDSAPPVAVPTFSLAAVPEPSTLTLLGLAGAGGLLALRRRRRAT